MTAGSQPQLVDAESRLRAAVRRTCISLLVLGTVATLLFAFVELPALHEDRANALTHLTQVQDQQPHAPPAAVPPADPATGPPADTTTADRAEYQRRLGEWESEHDDAVDAVDLARAGTLRGSLRLVGLLLSLGGIAWFLRYQTRRPRTRSQTVNAMTILVITVGIVLLATRLLLQKVDSGVLVWGLADIAVLHLCICAFMPVNVREATVPFALLLLVWAILFSLPGASTLDGIDRVVGILMSPMLLLPGGILASFRHQRRIEDAERVRLGQQVDFLGGELSRARIVHDAMFPRPFIGHVAFEYEYQPSQEIGGDYVHAYCCDDTGDVIVTLLDVAGHGLAAALTVNRLFGELERILAENTAATPGEIMTLLNRYIYLTMARHSLYATGTSMRLDPATGVLTWANAGHPPSLLRRGNGSVQSLETTSVLLGATPPAQFDPEPQNIQLAPGDVVIAYTDGAFEARDAAGQYFGLDGVREICGFSPPPRSWPRFIAGAVAKHRGGSVQDDVLIASITYASKRVAVPAVQTSGATTV